MVPAGNFFQHQQTQLVACIEEVRRLRIMRSANDVELEFFLQDVSIASLRASRHGLSDPGKSLMTIQTAQLDYLPVKLEPMISEACLAKSYAAAVFIDNRRALLDSRNDRVKIRIRQIPKLDWAKVLQS